MMLPIDKRENVSLMEVIHSQVKWVTWTLDCGSCKRIGCISQTNNMLYIIPENAGGVFTMNLEDEAPCPRFQHILPKLPQLGVSWFGTRSTIQQATIASRLEVSENGNNFIVYVQGTKQLLHLTRFTVRQLDRGAQRFDVSGFSLLGDNAVVCFLKDSKEFRLYNLKTRDLVRKFHFTDTPFSSFMGKNCIWSITRTPPSMSVFRLA